MTEIPTFSEYWKHTTKTGRKEIFAARFGNLSDKKKIALFKIVSELKTKPDPETFLK